MLAADPDEYNDMLYELEDLRYRYDTLRAELAIAQAALESGSQVMTSAIHALAQTRTRLTRLHVCPMYAPHISSIQHDLDAVIATLQKGGEPCT